MTTNLCQLSLHATKCSVLYRIQRLFQTGIVRSSQTTDAVAHEELYPGHRPTSIFQKVLLTCVSGVAALNDPARDDMICAMGEASGSFALSSMYKRMKETEESRQILWERPQINKQTINLAYLSELPEQSFGRAYIKFLHLHGFDPDARRPVQFVDDKELAYVMLRYRQIHDLTHTILGMKPNMLGEVSVKWFEAYQTGLPMCVAAAAGGPLRLGPIHSKIFWNDLMKWSVDNAMNSRFLMCVYWEKYWEMDLNQLRKKLNLTPPPINTFT